MLMKRFLQGLLGNRLSIKLYLFKKEYIDGFTTKIYSQEGEDIILREFFPNKTDGFYEGI